jgi:hypothetical protein
LRTVDRHLMYSGKLRSKAMRGGSFNPVHDGHRGMLAAAAVLRPGAAPCFELTVTNADKVGRCGANP